ncbi:MAG TPA: LysR family substrate-binding domain-containing protein, partial [Thermomonospora sp.]|nr:LysR family substrate-binding domain-containing protein [Thermomonospora sp.]
LPPRGLGPGFHDRITALTRAAGFEPAVAQEAVQMQTVVGLVAAGLGVSIVPESAARAAPAGAVFRPAEPGGPTMSLDLAWRRDDPSVLVRNFRETCAAEVSPPAS